MIEKTLIFEFGMVKCGLGMVAGCIGKDFKMYVFWWYFFDFEDEVPMDAMELER